MTLLAILVTLLLAVVALLVSGALAALVDPEIEGATHLLTAPSADASRNRGAIAVQGCQIYR
ncbi:hypothetical protein [Microbacterium sp. lyk4-40-TSB-66]|uniref:hypothetical protein n=1 Tax=Microbacterium sp. lyk4-40-TSB-66 TaxID=3040294 RepID=UPI00254D0E45|nr:hypothetical protein [Microbacterium sp. lyk4-40-TSB-66]